MLDFNTKKDILKRLRKKGSENVFMRVLCGLAAAFVKLWYGAVCGIGMAFSDKNGNFLGIKAREKAPKKRRQDDIVYVKKPFIGRVLSALLAAAFVLMIAPEAGLPDLGVTARAAEANIDASQDVTDKNGVVYHHNPNVSTDYLVFEKSLYDEAIAAQVDNITYDVGYGSVVVHWTFNSVASSNISGFNIILYDDNGAPLNGENGEDVGKQVRKKEYTGLATGDVYAIIRPSTYIKQYKYTPAVTETNPDTGAVTEKTPATFDALPENNQNMYLALGKELQGGTVTLNAELPIPNLQNIPDMDGALVTQPELVWSEVSQTGGKLEDQKPADGYIIYRKEGTRPFVEVGRVDKDSAVNGVITTSDTVLPGIHYQYFIEAYKTNWNPNGTNDKTYNPGNSGMISSSKSYITSTPDEKYNRVYAKSTKHLYVAPVAPSLTVTPNPGNNRIDLQSDPSMGEYTGVFLFRTTGEIEVTEKTEGVVLGAGQTFGEWFYNTGSNRNNTFGITPLGQLSGNNRTYNDTNILEGQTYWYYAVAYLQKDQSTIKLYSSAPGSNSSKLNLMLARPIGLTAENRDGQVNLTWEAVTGAQGYEIEIIKTAGYDSEGEKFPQIIYGDVRDNPLAVYGDNSGPVYDNYNKTSFLHNYLYNTDAYTYRVRAYINIQSVDENGVLQTRKRSDWSNYTKISSVGLPMSIPQNVAADGSVDGQITVTWQAVQGAASYTVYYENMNNSSDKGKVDGLTGTRYVHTNLENGERYSYYVVAHKKIEGDGSKGTQLVDSDPSGVAKAKVGVGLVTPQDLKVTTKDGEVTVTWSAVAGAQGYLLYYKKNEERFSEDKVFDLTRTTFNHTRLKNGDVYTYYVVAYKEVSGARDYSPNSLEVDIMVGSVLDTPKDFAAATNDGTVVLTWTAVQGAEGYIVYATSGGRYEQFDVSKTTYTHTNLENGATWSYRVAAYKTVNGTRTYSQPSETKTVSVGVSLNSAVDLTATAGNRQIDLSWTAVTGAEGYVVYLYNSKTMEFDPITATSKTTYSHVGLKNGKQYTYMVAPYKNINGKRFYGDYSMSVTAIPTTGSITDMDHELKIKGTAPYGISHGEYISAVSNHGAFDESVDVYFTTNQESTKAVKDVLKNYAEGLSSFIVYPFDISIYKENTFIKVDPADGYFVTVTMPVPDKLIAYRDYITVIHINENPGTEQDINEITLASDWLRSDDQRLEVLPCAIVDIDNVWCVQFKCTSFSPYALVIYKKHISDIGTGGGVTDGSFAGTFNSGVLLFTALPDIMPNPRRLRIVRGGSKRYRVKNVEKR